MNDKLRARSRSFRASSSLNLLSSQRTKVDTHIDISYKEMKNNILKKTVQSTWRKYSMKLNQLLLFSKFGFIVDSINCFICLLSCTIFVINTYYPISPLFDLPICLLLWCDYILHFVTAGDWIDFMISYKSILELGTQLPIILYFINPTSATNKDSSLYVIICCLQILRIVRAIRLRLLLHLSTSEVTYQIQFIVITTITICFIFSGLIYTLENNGNLWNTQSVDYPPYPDGLAYHHVVYLIITTIATVGFGDYAPKTTLGRYSVVTMVICAVILIPQETQKLLDILAMQTVYKRHKYKPGPLTEHVILCGDVKEGIEAFFEEFFHPDHRIEHSHVVILTPGNPVGEVLKQMRNSTYAHRIMYLDGSVMDHSDLERAAVESASAIFVLSSKYSKQPGEKDAKTILQAMSLKNYLTKKEKLDLFTCVQLIRPESVKLFASSLSLNETLSVTNQVLCIDELKMNLFARNCLAPGVTTFVSNLTRSITRVITDDLPPWKKEYLEGCGYEIYRVEISPTLEGMKFLEVADLLYEESGSLLFALEISLPGCEPKVFINPCEFILPPCKQYYLMGFVIAEDLDTAEKISSLNPPVHQRRSVPHLTRSSTPERRNSKVTIEFQKRKLSFEKLDPVPRSLNKMSEEISSLSMRRAWTSSNLHQLDPIESTGGDVNSESETSSIIVNSSVYRRASVGNPISFKVAKPKQRRSLHSINKVNRNLFNKHTQEKTIAKFGLKPVNLVRQQVVVPANRKITVQPATADEGVKNSSNDKGDSPKRITEDTFGTDTTVEDKQRVKLAPDLISLSPKNIRSESLSVHSDIDPSLSSPISPTAAGSSSAARSSVRIGGRRYSIAASRDSSSIHELQKQRRSVLQHVSHTSGASEYSLRGSLVHDRNSVTEDGEPNSDPKKSLRDDDVMSPSDKTSQDVKLPTSPSRRSSADTRKLTKNTASEAVERLKKSCYYLSTVKPLNFVTIRDMRVDLPNTKNHIIVVGSSISIYHFILPLRKRELGTDIKAIVIFSEKPLSDSVWNKLGHFPMIYFFQGNLFLAGDRAKVGLHYASNLVLLAEQDDEVKRVDHESMLDASTTFAYRVASVENNHLNISCEVISQNNFRFFHDSKPSSLNEADYEYPIAASGSVACGSLLDSLICQSFFNPYILVVINKLVSVNTVTDEEGEKLWHNKFEQIFEGKQGQLKDSKLVMIPLPNECLHMNYGELLSHLTFTASSLPVGIRRGVQNENKLGNELPYIYTNPSRFSSLYPGDHIYILKLFDHSVFGNIEDIKEENITSYDLTAQSKKLKSREALKSFYGTVRKGIMSLSKELKELNDEINDAEQTTS